MSSSNALGAAAQQIQERGSVAMQASLAHLSYSHMSTFCQATQQPLQLCGAHLVAEAVKVQLLICLIKLEACSSSSSSS
jgi:spore maturation protein SpmB